MSFNITPVASGYQEIHPYSAMNIDSVKINTSLIMMKECSVLTAGQPLGPTPLLVGLGFSLAQSGSVLVVAGEIRWCMVKGLG